MRYEFRGLIFGGDCIWRDLYSEFTLFGILRISNPPIPSNPVFGLAMSGRVTTVQSYSLRSCRNYTNKMCQTKRLSELVSVKYLDVLS